MALCLRARMCARHSDIYIYILRRRKPRQEPIGGGLLHNHQHVDDKFLSGCVCVRFHSASLLDLRRKLLLSLASYSRAMSAEFGGLAALVRVSSNIRRRERETPANERKFASELFVRRPAKMCVCAPAHARRA